MDANLATGACNNRVLFCLILPALRLAISKLSVIFQQIKSEDETMRFISVLRRVGRKCRGCRTRELELDRLSARLESVATQLQVLSGAVQVGPNDKAVDAQRDARNFRLANQTFYLTCGTAALTGFTLAALMLQAYLAQSSLEETQNEQRAWVRVSLELADLSWSTSPDHRSASASMGVRFKMSNVGHLPAFNVRSIIHGFYVIGPKGAINININRVCDSVEKNTKAVEQDVFPGENRQIGPVDIPNRTVFSDSLAASHEDDASPIPNDDFAIFVLYGCVVYKLQSGGGFHKSGFEDIIVHTPKNTRQILGFFPNQVPPLDEIKLYPTGSPSDTN